MTRTSTAKASGRSALADKIKGVKRNNDAALGWVEREYPQLSAWRVLAVEWLTGEALGVSARLSALSAFFERYLVRLDLPLDPAVFLARDTVLPDFYRTACPDSYGGLAYNNAIHAFLHFVLVHEFSVPDDHGHPVVSPAYRNPVARRSVAGLPKRDESVHSPLPYGYIDELRQILAAGPHFRDWQWAQSELGAEMGQRGHTAPDWFPVSKNQIDRSDPDCVWRIRERTQTGGGAVLEMWSPVRWVALLVKLILPLRTVQVRMLDSGEADTWRYEAGRWVRNQHPLAHGEQRPLRQGVFRRGGPLADRESDSTVLYINTNKTADIVKSATEKGYTLPWASVGPVHQDVFHWLEKLRNWQEKYNPVRCRTAWTELDGRHIKAKSQVQLAGYPDACFLFRLPEAPARERHLPIREGALEVCWFTLLETFESRLADRGETHRNGAPVRLLRPMQRNGSRVTLFPLHSLRVSLVTALALEGKVPFPLLQKLVGHSRLMMTLYYTKPGANRLRDVLAEAAERLEAAKEASIQNFLLDTEHDLLLEQAICNSPASLAAAVPEHPAARNAAGWMPMHHGLCLVGGNTSEVEGVATIGGCYNGGPQITAGPYHSVSPKYGPVPGGSRNCVRCRWFVTEPHYLPALAAHFNTLAYHFDESRNACLAREATLQELKKQKAEAEEAQQPFGSHDAYRKAERLWESAMKRFSDLAEDLVACYRLIERCKAAPERCEMKLVAAGRPTDLRLVFEETESELLQLAGVCQSAEVYPDLQPGKAVFRRSQLLDAMLYRDNVRPMFMLLSEEEQLRVGNAFIARLAQQMNPANPMLGQREVIQLMDAGESLSRQFGIDLASLLPSTGPEHRMLTRDMLIGSGR